MKKYIVIILMIQTQLVAGQILRPASPYEGQIIEARVGFFCPDYPEVNVQGLTHLVEYNDQQTISLYVVFDSSGGCPGVRPPPIPVYYELGALTEGRYTLQVFRVPVDVTLPVQNATPDFSFEFQVRGAPAAVNAFSVTTLLILVFGFLLITSGVVKFRSN